MSNTDRFRTLHELAVAEIIDACQIAITTELSNFDVLPQRNVNCVTQFPPARGSVPDVDPKCVSSVPSAAPKTLGRKEDP